MAGGRTTIAIAHRLATIVNSDTIAVVDQVWEVCPFACTRCNIDLRFLPFF